MDTAKKLKSSILNFAKKRFIRQITFLTAIICCCIPEFISPPIALVIGILFAQTIGHPFKQFNQKAIHILLQVSVVGLGFGMQAKKAFEIGKENFFLTLTFILITLVLGYIIGKIFRIENKVSFLIAAGTAICGGSAIAAISPAIKAQEKEITVALGTILILNSIALFIFPTIGRALNLSQMQFGIWSAVAIHDTSSVVGAANKYGSEALAIATTAKLSRALWVVPIAFIASYLFKSNKTKVKIPWFIVFFIIAMLANSYTTFVQNYHHILATASKIGLTTTLFLIGAGLDKKLIFEMGIKPFLQGTILWIIISIASLATILWFI